MARPAEGVSHVSGGTTGRHGGAVDGRRGPPMFPNPQPARPIADRPIATMVIDAEEDFDWLRPFAGTAYTTDCMRNIGDLQAIAEGWDLRPTYLLTYPILQDAVAVRALRRHLERGDCALGLQLHTWVTPPLGGETVIANSFSGNLPPAMEERKLLALKAAFVSRFGVEPVVFRSGRYGLSATTTTLLEKHGFEVDTSLAPRTDLSIEGGPDFSRFEYLPFWFGAERRLLEVPLCRSIVGWGGPLLGALFQKLMQPPLMELRISSVLTRSRAAERITLSPEGNDLAAIRRLVRRLVARGCTVLPLSFHSSSLVVGRNPYVGSKVELHAFYDRLSATLAFLGDEVGCHFASLPQVPAMMRPLVIQSAAAA